MANVVVNKFKKNSMTASIDLTAVDTLKCALINNIWGVSSTTEIADVQSFSAISSLWETSGINYTAGGAVLSGTTVTEDDSGDKSIFDADNVVWGAATVSAYGACIYRISDSLPICFVDFSGVKTSTAGDFTIEWAANGIVTLT